MSTSSISISAPKRASAQRTMLHHHLCCAAAMEVTKTLTALKSKHLPAPAG